MKNNKILFPLFCGFIYVSLFTACLSSKKLAYFNNIPTDSVTNIIPQTEKQVIRKGDILKIEIASLDEVTNRILNGMSIESGTGNTLGLLSGYLVDDNGFIKIPLLGSTKAAGLSKDQLEIEISSDLVEKKIAVSPTVSVRIINYKITVLGEVNKPGVIPVVNEKITLPEAIGLAGDLTTFGRRDNVLLIREINGKRTYKRFSLNQDQLFNKDIYYLQNQDLIYVEPTKAKAASIDRTTQLIPVILTAMSLITVIVINIIRK